MTMPPNIDPALAAGTAAEFPRLNASNLTATHRPVDGNHIFSGEERGHGQSCRSRRG